MGILLMRDKEQLRINKPHGNGGLKEDNFTAG
jgi:hypothetical protein